MKNHGFSGFPKVSWEIWVSKLTTPQDVCRSTLHRSSEFAEQTPGTAIESSSMFVVTHVPEGISFKQPTYDQ